MKLLLYMLKNDFRPSEIWIVMEKESHNKNSDEGQ